MPTNSAVFANNGRCRAGPPKHKVIATFQHGLPTTFQIVAEKSMNVLVGWDDPTEAETISVLLNVDDNFAKVVTSPHHFEQAAAQGEWDVYVQALSFPDLATSLELFKRIRSCSDDVPVIGVWRQDEIADLARFMSSRLAFPADARSRGQLHLSAHLDGGRSPRPPRSHNGLQNWQGGYNTRWIRYEGYRSP